MYKMSHVAYRINGGCRVVKTLDEAKATGLSYEVIYLPEYEEYEPDDEVKARRRKI